MFLQCQQVGSVASSHLKTTEWVLVVPSQTDFLWGGGGGRVSEGKGWVRVRDRGDRVGSGFARCLYNSNVYVLIALTLFSALDQIKIIFSE